MNALDIVCLVFGLVGIASTASSIVLDKRIVDKIQRYKKIVERKEKNMKSMEEEISFLKYQAGGQSRWIDNLLEETKVDSGDVKAKNKSNAKTE